MNRLNSVLFLLLLHLPFIIYSQQTDCEDTRAFLGVNSENISKKKAKLLGFENPYGNYITSIIDHTAAAAAGLLPFDYIYGIDNYTADSNEDLTSMLSHYKSGDEVILHFKRGSQSMSQLVTIGNRSNKRQSPRGSEQDPQLGISEMEENQDEIGVAVSVSNQSTAAEIGLIDGDLITAINGHPIIDWSDVTTAINAMEVGQTIDVEYEREGKLLRGSGPIKSRAETKQIQTTNRTYTSQNAGAFLGIYSNTLSPEKAKKLGFENQYGSYVSQVIGNTAAERAGIQPFDYIYGVEEYRTGSRQSLSHILQKYEPGDNATIYYIRKSKERTSNVTFGSRSEAVYQEVDKCEEPFFGVSGDHTKRWDQGVPVNIISNSTAASLGMQDGDVILTINEYPIIDWEDISVAVDNLKVGQNIKVTYLRNNREATGIQAIKSYCETKGLSGINDFKYEFNKDLAFPGLEKNTEDRTFKAVDFSNVKVAIQDMNQEETTQLRNNHGIILNKSDILSVNNLKLSAKPEKGLFKLSFYLPESGSTRIQIFNTAGRTIYDYDLGNYSGNFEDEVDISQNGASSYFLTVSQNNKTLARKVVLQKN
ncbi:MAG: PDZ domain-containing protein [Saprospiraceae bacterium]